MEQRILFEKENILFKRAVNGDKSARDEMITDSMFIAEQEAKRLYFKGKWKHIDLEDEIQMAYLCLVETIDAAVKTLDFYNVSWIRQSIRHRLISMYRVDLYGVDYSVGKMNCNKKQLIWNIINYQQIDEEMALVGSVEDSCLGDCFVDDILSILSDRDRFIVECIVFDKFTQSEVGDILGIAQCTVHQRYVTAMKKMKEYLNESKS